MMLMPQNFSEDSSRRDQKRVEAFLDCIAYLLAQRWLRDQRQQEEKPQERRKSLNEEV
jgi:hypothetical protein